jgi:hypothetical protein
MEDGQLEVLAAVIGRFYGQGVVWALNLPLPELIRWRDLMPRVRDALPPEA